MHLQSKYSLAYLAFITTSNLHHPLFANAQGLSCLESIDLSFSDTSIGSSASNLFVSSLSNSEVTSGNNTITTLKDYSNVKRRLLQNFERACLGVGNTTVCSMTESVEKGGFVYSVVEKPMCVSIENSDCPSGVSAISSDSVELMEAQDEIESVFEECVDILFGERQNRCEITTMDLEEISEYNIQIDFSSYLETEDGMAMKSACMAKNLTMCALTTTAMDGDIELYEIAKPLCLPSTCMGVDVSEIASLDPNPLCDRNCDVISQSLSCESMEETTGDSCLEDANALSEDVELSEFYDKLLSTFRSDCDLALQGESTAICSITVPSEQAVNINELDSNLVLDVMSSCIELGMNTCYVTGTSLSSTRDVESFKKEIIVYNEYPICVPAECADNIDVVLDTVLPSFSISSRTYEIENLLCDQTLSPSQSMLPSSTPTTLSSQAPTIMSSSSPSLSPSMTSTSPSITKSMPPSSHPTAAVTTMSPTEGLKVTEAPSMVQTMEPTPSPTISPVETVTEAPVVSVVVTEAPAEDSLLAESSDSAPSRRLGGVSMFLGGIAWMWMTL